MAVARPSPTRVRCKPGFSIKSSPTVDEIAHISPMCSTIVASEIGTIVSIADSTSPQFGSLNTAKAVFSILKGRPIQAACLTGSKSMTLLPQAWKMSASIYDASTPMIIGMILIIPLPKILQAMIATTAASAIHQLELQLFRAEEERVRPMAMMIGPVTTGGKKRITFLDPNAAKRAARMK